MLTAIKFEYIILKGNQQASAILITTVLWFSCILLLTIYCVFILS